GYGSQCILLPFCTAGSWNFFPFMKVRNILLNIASNECNLVPRDRFIFGGLLWRPLIGSETRPDATICDSVESCRHLLPLHRCNVSVQYSGCLITTTSTGVTCR